MTNPFSIQVARSDGVRIAMLGGSFNPVHIGHLVLADEVRLRLGYDKILFVPANIPPHKELAAGATAEERLEMLRLAVRGNSAFEIDECELRRGGVSYTFDTVVELQRKFGAVLESRIGLVIGDDLVSGFETWHRFADLPEITDIVLARRIVCHEENVPLFEYRHKELANALLPVSSTDIRESIVATGEGTDVQRAWRYLVPEAVYQYIIQRKLYGYKVD